MKSSEYFKYLTRKYKKSNINLIVNTGLGDTTISKLKNLNNYIPKKSTLKTLALNGFNLSVEDCETFFNNYGYTIIHSNQKDDEVFLRRLKNLHNSKVIFQKDETMDAQILASIKRNPYIVQESLAYQLNISVSTLRRRFRMLGIKTHSKKNPKWIIE